MTVTSRDLVELVLLGPSSDRRQLQDSPILGDVWIAYAAEPAEAHDLLITPYREYPAGPVAAQILRGIQDLKFDRESSQRANVAYLQGLVAARLFFEELLTVVVPMTKWWQDPKVYDDMKDFITDKESLEKIIKTIIDWAQAVDEAERTKLTEVFSNYTGLGRYLVLAGVILWAGEKIKESKKAGEEAKETDIEKTDIERILKEIKDPGAIETLLKYYRKKSDKVDIGSLLKKIEGPEEIVEKVKELLS